MEINKIESGRYLILNEIGKGGNALVYKAKDVKTGDIVAIKRFCSHDIHNKKRLMADVERELDVLKYIEHPALPKVFNVICKDNEFYLVMEFVEGLTLGQKYKQKRKIPVKQVIDITKQLLSAMYYLHSLESPIIYRDLKPDNIIIKSDGKLKLIDFGNSKKFNRDISADEIAVGTPNYAAPEQYGDREGRGIYNTDIRTDIYGVGAIMYYMATGHTIGGKLGGWSCILYNIRFGRKYKKIVNKATSYFPRDRFQDDIEMLVEIYKLYK